eukprot:TRINITY_DN10239_c0_g1_i2.p1 TRINITY_DN10239_c0_g1~~TRINITY_DN10239_c0_g1_i2.p1  ORF type:complete len:312 (-),score=32.92 TRINITY_DN10239_c0_g1_i2:39-974(-)
MKKYQSSGRENMAKTPLEPRAMLHPVPIKLQYMSKVETLDSARKGRITPLKLMPPSRGSTHLGNRKLAQPGTHDESGSKHGSHTSRQASTERMRRAQPRLSTLQSDNRSTNGSQLELTTGRLHTHRDSSGQNPQKLVKSNTTIYARTGNEASVKPVYGMKLNLQSLQKLRVMEPQRINHSGRNKRSSPYVDEKKQGFLTSREGYKNNHARDGPLPEFADHFMAKRYNMVEKQVKRKSSSSNQHQIKNYLTQNQSGSNFSSKATAHNLRKSQIDVNSKESKHSNFETLYTQQSLPDRHIYNKGELQPIGRFL